MAKIYVGNLPFTADEAAVRALFAQHGEVTSVALPVDRDTGRPRGFGFVEMSSDEEAQKAIAMFHDQEFQGRRLTVNVARPLAPREDRPRRAF